MLFLKSSGVKRPDTFASLSLEARISVFYHNAWSNDHVELIKAFLPTRVEEFRFVDDGHAFGLSLQWSHVARRSSCTSPRSSFFILQSIALENAAADNNAHIEFVFSEIWARLTNLLEKWTWHFRRVCVYNRDSFCSLCMTSRCIWLTFAFNQLATIRTLKVYNFVLACHSFLFDVLDVISMHWRKWVFVPS